MDREGKAMHTQLLSVIDMSDADLHSALELDVASEKLTDIHMQNSSFELIRCSLGKRFSDTLLVV